MDTDDSSPLKRPPPQKPSSIENIAGAPAMSAQLNATVIGAETPEVPRQRAHNAVADDSSTKQIPAQANLLASSKPMTLPFHGGPPTAKTQTQSNQADSSILQSDAYLSARKLLETTAGPDALALLGASSYLLTRLLTDISAGGHDDLLPEVMLPGLAHLLSLVEQICSTCTKATPSTTESTTANLETTSFTLRSHPAKSSAFSTVVSTTTSISEPATTVPATSPRIFTLPFRSPPAQRSASLAPASSPIAQTFRFSSLPYEVKIRTLSFVPETNVALSCRLVCREFRDFIDGNELQIAQLVAERERSGLQFLINMRRQIMPENLTDFVFDASRWVQMRGFCPSKPKVTIDAFTAWRLSTDGNRDMHMRGRNVPRDLVTWGILTTKLLRLQLDLHKDVDALGEKLMATLQDYAVPSNAACTTATLLEYQRLCFMIWDRPVSEPFFSGQEHGHADGEKGTFPELRLSTASYHDSTRGHRSLKPDFPKQDVQELGLPALEDKKFFYYFGQGVSRDVFERLYPLTPLKRASLLKMVELF